MVTVCRTLFALCVLSCKLVFILLFSSDRCYACVLFFFVFCLRMSYVMTRLLGLIDRNNCRYCLIIYDPTLLNKVLSFLFFSFFLLPVLGSEQDHHVLFFHCYSVLVEIGLFSFSSVCVWVCSVWTFSSAILIVLIKLGSHTEFLRIMNYMWHNNWEKVTIFLFRWSSVLVCIFNRNRDRYAHIAVWMITMLFYSPVYFFLFFSYLKTEKIKIYLEEKKTHRAFSSVSLDLYACI